MHAATRPPARLCLAVLAIASPLLLLAGEPLPGTRPLTLAGDLSAQMVEGIDRFLMRQLEESVARRPQLWQRDFTSAEAYQRSVESNRERFRVAIGAVDPRGTEPRMELVATTETPARVAETATFTVYAVRWPAFGGVQGEGLMLEPKGPVKAQVVALPDAGQTPEQLAGLAPGLPPEHQFARTLAERGCLVIVPVLINRDDSESGSASLKRFTNQPHREWIYRMAFEMGRHVIGYEVQKVLAAVDWFGSEAGRRAAGGGRPKIGVMGYGEGGLLAFHAAALDPRVDAAVVSGYFDSRQGVWQEPIYRNVFRLLAEFGDAEIASLVYPRGLVIEFSEPPRVDGPPLARTGRTGAAPGRIGPAEFNAVEAEVQRTQALLKPGKLRADFPEFLHGNEGAVLAPGSPRAVTALLRQLGVNTAAAPAPEPAPADLRKDFNPDDRQRRQFKQLEDHTQGLLRVSSQVRDEFFWTKVKPAGTNEWRAATRAYQSNLWENVIGRFPAATLPANPRSRLILDQPTWTGYDVQLDVWPDVYAWGVLLLPKDLKPGERRPVVVTQHGLEGVPEDTINEDPKSRAFGPYKAFSTRLVERGFIVFAPHNPYRGLDKFRVLQRKANPLGKSLFSVILAQHDRILDWLSEQPFVDPQRIGFYGLSYGGKTAMRVPSLLDRYCLSICSGDFNEWIWKNVTVDWRSSYMFTQEYEMYEFNLGHTFNYAEMAALICPRPFMVERGHVDGVGLDEWVAHEYAKVRRVYGFLGIPQSTQIEFFNGPHTIHGQGAYDFLHQHLHWPKR
jgi:dienelactone hydrolase